MSHHFPDPGFALNLPEHSDYPLSRELAQNDFTRPIAKDAGLAENWTAAARMLGVGLFCTSMILAGALLLTLAALLLRWLAGLL